jgi:glutathione synthase/RimK-type ligase-like ATP-grasp enzyme
MSDIVVMTDHDSGEGSQPLLEAAVESLTGRRPVSIDARHFLTGGNGRVSARGGTLRLAVPSEDLVTTPDVLIVYEIAPAKRQRFAMFQRTLLGHRSTWWGANVDGWRAATDKHQTVARFRREGIRHMETIALCRPDPDSARDAFHQLGRDVWTRPRIGVGGQDVFHVTTLEHLHHVRRHYAASDQDWLVSRDARNIGHHGHRHQFRVVVLHDRVLRVCEHVQSDPDAPCNESRGAVSTTVAVDDFPPEFAQLAISATRSLGLPFGGVDLAIENGGVVFEVNVHPVIDVPGGLETLAIPIVQAHLSPDQRPSALTDIC